MVYVAGHDGLPTWAVVTSILICSTTTVKPEVVKLQETVDVDLPYYCSFCLCQNISGYVRTDCSGKGLYKLPKDIDVRTIELFLSGNFILSVKFSYFTGIYNLKVLDLSENRIAYIEVGAFRDLTNLSHLYLNGQRNIRLFILQNVLTPGVFKGLTSLTVLHVHDCLDIIEADTSHIPVDALIELTALEELRIDGVANASFNEAFRQLKNLSTVVMSGFDGLCRIGYLDRHSFVGLENLKNLTINKCNIKTVQTGTFWWTTKLNYLDMSWNTDLEIRQFGKVLEELKYTSLEALKINAIHNPDRAGTEILRSDVTYLRDMDLTELHMDDNGIEYVDYGVFDMFPKTLKSLFLRRNKLNFGIYMNQAVFNNPNLELLDAGDQAVASRSDRAFTSQFRRVYGLIKRDANVEYLILDRNSLYKSKRLSNRTRGTGPSPSVSNLINRAIKAKRSTPLSQLNLRTLIYSGSLSDVRPLDFTASVNNITFMDLSRNFMPMLEPYAFEGLYHLKYLNVSHNFMEHVHPTGFHGLNSLEVIDLKDNLLGFMLRLDKRGKMFSSLVQLKTINLSRNRINSLDKHIFKYTTNIETINLSENYIENIDVELTGLGNLRYIDLSFNRLHSLPQGIRTHFDYLSKYHEISVDLSNNKLLCNCENIPFLKWLFQSRVKFQTIDHYYCSQKNNTVRFFNESRLELLEQIEQECMSYLEIIVGSSTGSSFFLSCLASFLIYKNRWKLRYLYYMARVKFENKREDVEADDEFLYDVFISYGDGDRAFVVGDMLQNLEAVGGKRLNIRDRNFELGEVIAVNISKAVRTSKKTFLMLSRHFLRSKWCNFEMNMARMEAVHMKRDVIVIIFLETIPPEVLPLEIMDLLRECPSLDVPKDKAFQAAFWHKCIDYINHGG